MENRLQELTQKLYDEGLAKGRSEADEILSKAKDEAKSIIDNAKAESAAIMKKAQNDADELKKNTQTEIVLASRQSIASIKQQIENMIVASGVTQSVKQAVADPSLVKEVIVAVSKNWNGATGESVDLNVLLPTSTADKFIADIKSTVSGILANGLEIATDAGVKTGFKIGPKDGSYYISFSDADFDALFKEYLRPRVSQMLYADQNK